LNADAFIYYLFIYLFSTICYSLLLLFIYSPFSELIDTFFIIIHKKKLLFLHWYHHVTVLLYCWQCFAYTPSYAVIFMTMNYGVHALMYGYYFLMAVKMKPAWFNPMIITFVQSKLAQDEMEHFVDVIASYHTERTISHSHFFSSFADITFL